MAFLILVVVSVLLLSFLLAPFSALEIVTGLVTCKSLTRLICVSTSLVLMPDLYRHRSPDPRVNRYLQASPNQLVVGFSTYRYPRDA